MITNVFVANGFMGGESITDTTPHSQTAGKTWKGVFVTQDCVFTTLTGNIRGDASFGGGTIKQGMLIPGTFSTVTLASGAVIALDNVT